MRSFLNAAMPAGAVGRPFMFALQQDDSCDICGNWVPVTHFAPTRVTHKLNLA